MVKMGIVLINLSNLSVFVFLEKFRIFSNFFYKSCDFFYKSQEQIIPNISHSTFANYH